LTPKLINYILGARISQNFAASVILPLLDAAVENLKRAFLELLNQIVTKTQ